MMADLENDIVCVERIDEYSRIEQEVCVNMRWPGYEIFPASVNYYLESNNSA